MKPKPTTRLALTDAWKKGTKNINGNLYTIRHSGRQTIVKPIYPKSTTTVTTKTRKRRAPKTILTRTKDKLLDAAKVIKAIEWLHMSKNLKNTVVHHVSKARKRTKV